MGNSPLRREERTFEACAMADRDRLEGARADRDWLLAHEHWLSDEAVVEMPRVRLGALDAGRWTEELRREKRLFGVRYRERYLHPEFQFDLAGSLLPTVPALISLLPMTDANWTAAFWLFQPDRRFGGRRPVDVFRENPDAVVKAAKEDFVDGPYEGEPVLPTE